MKVVILEAAEVDLQELRRYIVKIKESIRNLAAFPYLGAIPPELEALHLTQYRQLLSGKNRIIYEVRGETVYVHIVVDMRRDMTSLLLQRLVR
jgi:toxin ParE1/3/4